MGLVTACLNLTEEGNMFTHRVFKPNSEKDTVLLTACLNLTETRIYDYSQNS